MAQLGPRSGCGFVCGCECGVQSVGERKISGQSGGWPFLFLPIDHTAVGQINLATFSGFTTFLIVNPLKTSSWIGKKLSRY